MDLSLAHFDKCLISLRWRLVGEKMFTALQALELVERYEKGHFRKDGKTPSVIHQIKIALHAFTLKNVISLEQLICTILLHDIIEDHDIDDQELRQQFGTTVYNSVWAMSKKSIRHKLKRTDMQHIFEGISQDKNASLAKGLDRINNFQSMAGVFTRDKQLSYIEEGKMYFLPMLKAARKRFPEQTDAYLNIETVLKYQIQLLEIINSTPG